MEADGRRRWTLLSSHGHVLVEIARNPRARVRDISAAIGITERATQAIIADLERAGYVERLRIGRRTHYVLHPDNAFRHSAQDGLQVGPFLELLAGTGKAGGAGETGETNETSETTGADVAGETGVASAEEPVLTEATEVALAAAALALNSEPVLDPVPGPELPLNSESVLNLEPLLSAKPALDPEPVLDPEPALNPEPGPGLKPDLTEPIPLSPEPPPLLAPAAEAGGGPAPAGADVPEPDPA